MVIHNVAANTPTIETENLPISWNEFLNVGLVCYDNPQIVFKMGTAIVCTTNQVTIGINSESTGNKYMRYLVFGK